MSRPTPSLLRQRRGEDGFTLIEVLVALAVLSIVAVSAVPLLASAGRAARSARFATQAKNLGQERIERMRNLPYYVEAANGPFRDLFDTYYPRLTPAATGSTVATATTGYVSATSARVPGEPAGAFFRVVETVPEFLDFRQIVATQFITATGGPVTPAASYNTTPATVGADAPASGLVGVTVLTSYVKNGVQRPTRYYTRIIEGRPAAQVILSQARSSALRVVSATLGGSPLTLEAGIVAVDGSRSVDSSASMIAQGALALRDTATIEGATKLLSAPPTRTETVTPVPGQGLNGLGCVQACFGSTTVTNAGVSVLNGLPKAGVGPASVESAVVKDGTFDLQYNNESPDAAFELLSARSMVHVPGAGGNLVLARGFVDATATSVTSGSEARTQVIKLFPTSFAPNGVIQVVLENATLGCSVTRAGGVVTRTSSADFRALVRYRPLAASLITAPDGYNEILIEDGLTSDPLADVDMTTKVSATRRLDDYVASWGALTKATATNTVTDITRGLRVSLDGVVSITTKPTKSSTATSAISLRVGSLSCFAEDNR